MAPIKDTSPDRRQRQAQNVVLIALLVAFSGAMLGVAFGIVPGTVSGPEVWVISFLAAVTGGLMILVIMKPATATSVITAVLTLYFVFHLNAGAIIVFEASGELVVGLGYEIKEAESAAEALAVIESGWAVDLLFTDVVMPGGMNGKQLADEALMRRPRMKVLFTSGYTEDAIVHQGRLEPGVHLLGKPYRRADLVVKIRQALQG